MALLPEEHPYNTAQARSRKDAVVPKRCAGSMPLKVKMTILSEL